MDGIKFLIDLDSRTRGATDAIQGLRGVDNAAQSANRHVQEMGGGAKGLSRDVFTAEFAVHALEHAWNLAKRAADKMADTIRDTIKTVAGDERNTMALTNMMGDKSAAKETLEYLERFSQLTEFSKDESESFGVSLMKAGYKGQEFNSALEAIADAASMSANKIEGAGDALSALTRMKLTGKLDARTLKGLGLDAREVTSALGDALGMTPKSVKKALEEGTIPAARAYETVLRAIEKKTGKELGTAGLAAGSTLGAKLTHLAELPQRIMGRLEGSPAMERIKDRFDKMLAGLDPDSPSGQKMLGGLERLMGTIADIDFDPLLKGLAGVPALLGTWIDPLSKVIGLLAKLTEGMLALPTFGSDLGDWLARKLHPKSIDQTPAWKREALDEKAAKQKAFDTDNERELAAAGLYSREPTKELDAAVLPSGEPTAAKGLSAAAQRLPNIGRAPAESAPISANVTTHVHIGNVTGSVADVHEAAAKGTQDGLKQVEKQAVRSGVRSPRSRVGAPNPVTP